MLNFSLSGPKDFRKFSNYLEKTRIMEEDRRAELRPEEAGLRMCVYWGAG